jgi:hypothetical protein
MTAFARRRRRSAPNAWIFPTNRISRIQIDSIAADTATH